MLYHGLKAIMYLIRESGKNVPSQHEFNARIKYGDTEVFFYNTMNIVQFERPVAYLIWPLN